MRQNKSGLVGSNGMLFVFPYKDFQMAQIQCSAKRQIHEATMMFTKKYYRSMKGFNKNSKGEGSSMVDYSENRCSITDISKCMVCVAHKNNTINKEQFADAKIEAEMSELYKKILSDILDLDYEMVEDETYSASLSDSNS
jgi:predicted transcriptional regulator